MTGSLVIGFAVLGSRAGIGPAHPVRTAVPAPTPVPVVGEPDLKP